MVSTIAIQNNTATQQQKSYQLLPYDYLIKRAIPKQIKEALRLHKSYGDKDPEIAIRYLMLAITDEKKLIKNFVPAKDSVFNEDELLESLPKNWEEMTQEFIKEKPKIDVLTLFEFLFPNQNFNDLETFDIMEIYLPDKLKEWGWHHTNNPRVFNNPWTQYQQLALF